MYLSAFFRQAPMEQSLDGEWAIAFDPNNIGKKEGWQDRTDTPPGASPIAVPSCWQTLRPHYDGVAWYRRTFRLPSSERNGAILIEFDAVNYAAEVWVDGSLVGRHEGGYTPFRLDITEALSADDMHTLMVRVIHPPKNCRPLEGLVLKELPCWREWESYCFGGVWQSVRLLNLPGLHIADCFIQPNAALDGIDVDLWLSGPDLPPKVELEVELLDASSGKVIQADKIVASLDDGKARFHVPIESPRPWSPDDPYLYALRLRMAGNGGDAVTVRFGLRRLELRDGRFVLNGKAIFIKGAFHEGLYPGGVPTPPSRAFVEDEIRKAKSLGFNLLRYWQIPIHPLVLDVADELGMMLMDEPAIEWMLQTDRTVELCRREVRDLVLRDRNRPSVAFWAIVNESGVIPFHHWPFSRTMPALAEYARLAQTLDPTRLIIDHSGGWFEQARLYGPGCEDAPPFNDYHIYRRAPTTDAWLADLRTVGGADGRRSGQGPLAVGAPTFTSEFGYGSIPDLARIVRRYEEAGLGDNPDCVYHRGLYESLKLHMGQKGLYRLFESAEDFIRETQRIHGDGNRLQAEAIRANPLNTGYVMHALSAGGWILGAELLDMWRNEKLVCDAVREAQAPRRLCVFLDGPACVEAGQPLRVEVVLANDQEAVRDLPLAVHLSSRDGRRTVTLAPSITAPSGVNRLWQGEIDPGPRPGEIELRFMLGRGDSPIAVGRRTAWVVEPAKVARALCAAFIGPRPPQDAIAALARMGVEVVDRPDAADWIFAVMPIPAPSGGWGVQNRDENPVLRWANEGKRILLLGSDRNQAQGMSDMLLLNARARVAVGNWSPVAHIALDRALLTGLPDDRILGQAYANVLPTHGLVGRFPPRTSAMCLSYQPEDMGGLPLDFWCGSTLFDFSVGKGSVTGCAFQLLGHLPRDPVARRLLLNVLASR
ncbi:MAG: sugar-binding domain-containing protein [Planctomycetota bacterium]